MSTNDKLADALRKAFDLGQRYWMLADSESYSDNRKSADVLARFDTLKREAIAELDAQPAQGEFLPSSEQPPFAGIAGCRPLERAPQPAPAPVQVDGWCSACGCGSDAAGYAHLSGCINAQPPAPGETELPAVALARAVEVLQGMGYQWLNGTWAPYLPNAAPGSGSGGGAHNRLAALAQQRVPDARNSITLTGEQIRDLASFVGMHVDVGADDENLMSKYVICECPPDGVLNEGEPSDPDSRSRYAYIAYDDEYPEEGCIGLGPEIDSQQEARGNGE